MILLINSYLIGLNLRDRIGEICTVREGSKEMKKKCNLIMKQLKRS